MEGTKACVKCGEVKSFSEFARNRTKKYGLASECLICMRQYQSQYRSSGARSKAERANPVTRQLAVMIKNSRIRAKKKGLEHDIDVKYLRTIVPHHCPYLGIELRWEIQAGLGVTNKTVPNSPSLDRIDSTKGYVRGNVVIVSHRANAIKSNATEQELFRIGRALSLLKAEMAFPD